MTMQVARTDYQGKGRWKRIADGLNTLGVLINSLTGENGVDIYAIGDEIRIANRRQSRGSGIDWSTVPFGYEILGGAEDNLKIKGGYIEHRGNLYQVGDTTITLTGGTQFVFVQYVWDNAASIPDPAATRAACTTDSTAFRKPLFRFSYNVTTGTIAREAIEWWGGNIHV